MNSYNFRSTFCFIFRSAILFSFLIFLFALPKMAEAASLELSPSSGSYSVGETFTVNAVVNSGSDEVNAVEASLSFDNDVLSVTNVSDSGSVLSLWTTEPTHSNPDGTISFGGGDPAAFSGESTLVKITFKVESEGEGDVKYSSGGVTAADGTGQDILSDMGSATYSGESASEPEPEPDPEPDPEPEPEPEPEPTSSGDTPSAPSISSDTHPEDDPWHNEYEADFSWDVPDDVTALRLLVGRQSEATPTVVYDPPIDSRELDDEIFDEDGLWYFHIQYRNSGGWGDITHYEFGFDTKPPAEFKAEVVEGEGTQTPTIEFEAEDELSGIKEYVIEVEGIEDEITISADDHSDSDNRYTFEEPLPEGEGVVEVLAVDNAGNERSASVPFIAEAGESDEEIPDIADDEEDEEEEVGFFSKHGTTILIIFLLAVIFALVGYIWKLKKRMEQMKKKGKREVYEVRDELSRVFSALRDEAEDLFASFDGKEGLSPKEKESFKKISDAIDVSEEIVGKEIDDIEKLME